jgi:hypothetical protein
MRFEVNLTDSPGLQAAELARIAHNTTHPDAPIGDLPAFVQFMMDGAVEAVVAQFVPLTLNQAVARIAALETEKTALADQVATLTAATQLQVSPGALDAPTK